MKFKLTGGAELDLLTKDELKETLQDYYDKLQPKITYRHIPLQILRNSGGEAVITNGPDAGFIWSIKLLAINTWGGAPANIYLYVSQYTRMNALVEYATNTAVITQAFTGEQLVLHPGQRLLLSDQSNDAPTTALTELHGHLTVAEVPYDHPEWL